MKQHEGQKDEVSSTTLLKKGVLVLFAIPAFSGCLAAAAATPPLPAANVVNLTVGTPHSGFNRLLVSITLCVPRRTECVTIDDVMVDTGSTGLRLEAAAVPASFHLPAMAGPKQTRLGECVRFVHDNAWGPLFRADLRLGGMVATDLPIQIIGAGRDSPPTSCPGSGMQPTSNGTLGIGPELTDCKGDCQQSTVDPSFFSCAETCVPISGRVDPSYRLPNPVALFSKHNNGVVIDIPVAPKRGARALRGRLIFGVSTSTNNRLGQAPILRLDRSGRFKTIYKGRTYPQSYIDSGTESYIVFDEQLPRCKETTWAFCIAPTRRLDATIVGVDDRSIPVSFQIGDYRNVLAHGFGASDGMAEATTKPGGAFVWGAPFFIGRRIDVVMDGKMVPGAASLVGPLYGLDRTSLSP